MQESKFRAGPYVMLGLAIIIAAIALDQYTKWLVTETVLRAGETAPGFLDWLVTPKPLADFMARQDGYSAKVLTPFLDFVMVWNRGVSFGMFDHGDPPPPALFIALSLAISAGLSFWTVTAQKILPAAATALVIGGALGNVADRLRFGAVADFIDFHIYEKHWPAFNVADSCVVVGAVLLVADALFFQEKQAPAQEPGMKEV